MSWIQLSTNTDKQHAEKIEDALLAAEAVSVTLMDAADTPVLEPEPGTTPIWNETRIMGLFPAETNTKALLKTLSELLAEDPNLKNQLFKTEILEDKDWEREWMKNFHPIQCGQRLWICPSWREPPNPEAVNLLLDPGLAFGTGTHPTTFLCLNWLDQLDVQGKTLIDYGCGSGILAIAGLLLGATSAIGIDIDPQALIATRDNAERNKVDSQRIEVYLPKQLPQSRNPIQADIVLANILAQPLIDLAPTIAGHVKPGGKIALSGIIERQAEEICTTYKTWFELSPVVLREGWALVHGTKKA